MALPLPLGHGPLQSAVHGQGAYELLGDSVLHVPKGRGPQPKEGQRVEQGLSTAQLNLRLHMY